MATEPLGTLQALDGYWLDIRCGCGCSTDYPLRLMGRRYGGDAPLDELLPRLRCKRCRRPPTSVDLVDNPQLDAPGYVSNSEQRVLRWRLVG